MNDNAVSALPSALPRMPPLHPNRVDPAPVRQGSEQRTGLAVSAGSATVGAVGISPPEWNETARPPAAPGEEQPLGPAQAGVGFGLPVEELHQIIEAINDFLQSANRALEFTIDEETGLTVIKVMDVERQELIRQIPPDIALDLIAHFRDHGDILATGLAEQA